MKILAAIILLTYPIWAAVLLIFFPNFFSDPVYHLLWTAYPFVAVLSVIPIFLCRFWRVETREDKIWLILFKIGLSIIYLAISTGIFFLLIAFGFVYSITYHG